MPFKMNFLIIILIALSFQEFNSLKYSFREKISPISQSSGEINLIFKLFDIEESENVVLDKINEYTDNIISIIGSISSSYGYCTFVTLDIWIECVKNLRSDPNNNGQRKQLYSSAATVAILMSDYFHLSLKPNGVISDYDSSFYYEVEYFEFTLDIPDSNDNAASGYSMMLHYLTIITNLWNINRINRQSTYFVNNGYNMLMRELNGGRKIYSWDEARSDSKNKRSIIGFISLFKSISNGRRIDRLEDSLNSFKKDVVVAFNTVNKRIDVVETRLTNLEDYAEQIHKDLLRGFKIVQQELNRLSRELTDIREIFYVKTKMDILTSIESAQLLSLLSSLTKFTTFVSQETKRQDNIMSAYIDVLNGKIPMSLIPISLLRETLDILEIKTFLTINNYEFSFNDLSSLYTSNIVEAAIDDKGSFYAYVSIPIKTKSLNDELYNVKCVEVQMGPPIEERYPTMICPYETQFVAKTKSDTFYFPDLDNCIKSNGYICKDHYPTFELPKRISDPKMCSIYNSFSDLLPNKYETSDCDNLWMGKPLTPSVIIVNSSAIIGSIYGDQVRILCKGDVISSTIIDNPEYFIVDLPAGCQLESTSIFIPPMPTSLNINEIKVETLDLKYNIAESLQNIIPLEITPLLARAIVPSLENDRIIPDLLDTLINDSSITLLKNKGIVERNRQASMIIREQTKYVLTKLEDNSNQLTAVTSGSGYAIPYTFVANSVIVLLVLVPATIIAIVVLYVKVFYQ